MLTAQSQLVIVVNMESSKIPMRGKVKDAEAEALLRLLRQEKEYSERLLAPQIQQRVPLPAIGSSGNDNTTQQPQLCEQETVATFITQTGESSGFLYDNYEKELLSDSNFIWTPKTDVDNQPRASSHKGVYVPSFSWRDEQCFSYPQFDQPRKKSKARTLPPIEIPVSPCSDLPERPTYPRPGSPKFWDD